MSKQNYSHKARQSKAAVLRRVVPIERHVLESVAEIIGPQSASRRALDEADKHNGPVRFYQGGDTVIVEKL